MQTFVIHWFRRDLRLIDNTALLAAAATGQPVLPMFILDEAIYKGRFASGSRLAFMLKALRSLDEQLKVYGSRLLVKRGEPGGILHQLVAEAGASAV